MAKRTTGVRATLRTCASVLAAGAAFAAAGVASAEAPVIPAEKPVGGEYIVVFEEGSNVSALMQQMEQWSGAKAMMQYTDVLPGGLFKMSESEARLGAKMPGVAYIEENGVVELFDTNIAGPRTYGIDRIDQPALPLDRSYKTQFDGSRVTIYVIDTGLGNNVGRGNPRVAGRTRLVQDFINDGQNGVDCNRHGTHVTGTAAAKDFGVAQNANIAVLRVFNCTGGGASNGIIVGALDAATRDHQPGQPAVANLSLGGGASPATDAAVARAVQDGIVVVVAAGNSNADACGVSPARAPAAITVGASDMNDTRARFSNFGSCVDIFAPGVGITSLNFQDPNGTTVLNGTSMASPHVAGAAALLLDRNPNLTPAQVAQELQRLSVAGVIRDAQSAQNRLVQVPK